MSLADIIRTGIELANDLTEKGELQEPVTLDAWTDQSVTASPIYNNGGAGLRIPALVEYGVDQVLDEARQVIPVQAKVTFLRPIAANGAKGRQEPLDPRDRITLPNGSTGPIVKVRGFVDGGTSAPYMLEVWIGV